MEMEPESEGEFVSNHEDDIPEEENESVSLEENKVTTGKRGLPYEDGSTGGKLHFIHNWLNLENNIGDVHHSKLNAENLVNLAKKIDNSGSSEGEGKYSQDYYGKPVDQEEHTSSKNTQRIENLLKDFNPSELIQKTSTKERLSTLLLKIKAIIPLAVSLFMIYLITFVYLFTYCVPIVFDGYNDKTNFFFDDPNELPGLRKLPHGLRVVMLVLTICFFIIINISFFRAAYTPAGNLPNNYEWDVRSETLSLFYRKNQMNKDLLSIDIDRVGLFSLISIGIH